MKARESGMPDEKMWAQFFDVENTLLELDINHNIEKLVDFGFGYGTFTIPAAGKIKGVVYAYDIEDNLIQELQSKLNKANISNVFPVKNDFINQGTSFSNEEIDYVMLFNILHAERSVKILNEAYRILKPKGKVGIIHWIYDAATPRGPSMSIRPKPEDLKAMLIRCGFSINKFNINLPPYHFGILAQK